MQQAIFAYFRFFKMVSLCTFASKLGFLIRDIIDYMINRMRWFHIVININEL
jgi:hypothetical protein